MVWLEEAFHHLEPRSRVGGCIAALVSVGGRMVVAETNALNPFVQLRLLRARGLPKVRIFTDDRGRTHEYGVERVTSARRLARLFEEVGFETELVSPRATVSQYGGCAANVDDARTPSGFLPRYAFVPLCLRRSAREMTVAPRDAETGLPADAGATNTPIEVIHVITSPDVGGAETMPGPADRRRYGRARDRTWNAFAPRSMSQPCALRTAK